MAGVTSLLKSAATRRQKIQDQQDAEVAYQYSQSAKSLEDFQEYSKYLKDRQVTADPSKALTYEKNLNSAQSSYISNEVQRQTINVMEGTGDNQTKQQKLVDLYYQAANSGNYDLAQSLRSQIDSLSITIQNEAETRAAAGQALAGKMATLNANSVADAVDTVKSYISDVGNLFKAHGPEEFQKEIGTYAKELGLNKDAGLFDVLTNLAQSAVAVYDNAIASETDPTNIRNFTKARNDLVTGDSFELPGTNGTALKVSVQDLKDQADAARVGQTLLKENQTQEGTVFTKNKKTGFVFGRDEAGNYRQIPLYGNAPNYTSTVANTDPTKANYSYSDILKKNGIDATQSDGFLTIDNRDGRIPGFPIGQAIRAYVGPDGQLQVSNGSDIFNLSFDPTGTFKGIEKYNPSAITQFNGGVDPTTGYLKGDAQFNQPYYQNQDLSGYGDLGSLVGVVDQDLAARYSTVAGNFAGAGTIGSLNIPKTPASILQPAAAPQLTTSPQTTVSPQITAPSPQQTVNPFNLPAQPKLVVAAPAPVPKVTVAAPTPVPQVKVAAPAPTPRVRVG